MSEQLERITLDPSMSSVEGSPAKTSAIAEKWQESTAHEVVYGASTSESFAYYDPAMHLLRTSQLSLGWDLNECFATLPKSGSMQNGRLYRRPQSEPPIGATEYGYWPTPDVRGFTNEGSIAMLCRKVSSYPELRAMSYRGNKKYRFKYWSNPEEFAQESIRIGKLNPAWLEWLMGYPNGWTESKVAATR